MKTYAYSSIANNSVLDFDPLADVLWFDSASLSAADLTLTPIGAGVSMLVGTPGKSFTLDGASLATLDSGNVVFANGSLLVNSTAGTLYANTLLGGNGADLLVGGAATLATTRASVSSAGVQGNDTSYAASLSGDGRFVAFISTATNLVGADSNRVADIFVKDLVTSALTRVSNNSLGSQANGSSASPSISDDGRLVVFDSSATNLVGGDSNGRTDVFVKDLSTGVVTRVSAGSAGAQGDRASSLGSISADGRYVAFQSNAGTLVDGDTNSTSDIFVKSLSSGALFRVSTTAEGAQANDTSELGSLSSDGRWVVFQSTATNLVIDGNGTWDIFVKDLANGSVMRASTSSSGVEANGSSVWGSISADGRWVTFESNADNLVAGDTNAAGDVFLKDLWNGTLTRVSTSGTGGQGNAGSYGSVLSADGRFVSFVSYASNLVAGDTNATSDVFVKDMLSGAITRASVGAAGAQATTYSTRPTLSADGSTVAFDTGAPNLVPGDGNGIFDVFVTTNALEARSLNGGAGNDAYLIANTRDTITDPSGIDTVRASISYVLPASIEQLELLGTADLNATGNSAGNLITGNAGNNLIDGASGTDTVSYATAGAAVTVDLDSADAQVTGGAGNDTLLRIENLVGSAFDDALLGNAAANLLDGGAGNDTLLGGAGNDTYAVDRTGDQIIEEDGTDTVRSTLSWTLADGLENLSLLGSAHLRATGNAAKNVLAGNSGNNLIDGGGGIDTTSYAAAVAGVKVGLDKTGSQSTGGAGLDTLVSIENLTGSSFADTMHGNAGNNVLDGGAGVDTLSYARATAAVTLSLAIGTGQATIGAGTDTVLSFENLTGSAFDDTLTGSSLDNLIDGGAGADTMAGGAGNDTYVVDSSADVVTEVSMGGLDTLLSGVSRTLGAEQDNLTLTGIDDLNATGNDLANVLTGNVGANVLNGGGGIDTANYAGATFSVAINLATGLATGGAGSDTLVSVENAVGSAYDDALAGSSSANVLAGGAGNDTLTGGAGNDGFVIDSRLGTDTISDFASGADRLRISQAGVAVGNGTTVIEGAVTVGGPGGFAASAEWVLVTANIGGAITSASAAAAIGNATSAYAQGRTALFAVDNGSSSALWLFSSLDANAVVSADELTLLATLPATPQLSITDCLFVA